MAKRTNLVAGLLAVATTLGIAIPSQAQNFSDIESLINSWLQSRVIGDLAPSQVNVQANLQTRRSQLEAQINAGVANGRITDAEAIALRAELATVTARISTDIGSGGGLTIGEVRDRLSDLRTLAINIQNESNDNDTIAGGGGTVSTDFMVRVNDLRTRIQTARGLGQLRRNEANQMISSLHWIRAQHNRFLRGGLTASESATLSSYLGTVETRFNSRVDVATGTPDPAINSRIAQLRTNINTALSSRQLTRRQANELVSSLNWIASRHTAMLAGGLTAAERTSLESYLTTVTDKLSSWATVAVNPALNLDSDIARVRTRIDAGVAAGDLDWSDAQRLYRDLDYLSRMENQLSGSGGSLTQEEFNYLRRMLSSLEQGINDYM